MVVDTETELIDRHRIGINRHDVLQVEGWGVREEERVGRPSLASEDDLVIEGLGVEQERNGFGR